MCDKCLQIEMLCKGIIAGTLIHAGKLDCIWWKDKNLLQLFKINLVVIT